MRANAVVVHDGPWYAVAVIPAGASLDVGRLRHLTRRWSLEMAGTAELPGLFPDVEAGAAPPAFGRRYGLDLYLDRDLVSAGEIDLGDGAPIGIDRYLMAERPAVADLRVHLETRRES